MTTDRTTKALLAGITVALWALLLRPLFAPAPAKADPPAVEPFGVAVGEKTPGIYVLRGNQLTRYDADLRLLNRINVDR